MSGHSGVWWEDLNLFEKPRDTVFPLSWGKVERMCKGLLMSLWLTEKAELVCAAKDVTMMPGCLDCQVGWLLMWEIEGCGRGVMVCRMRRQAF